MTPSRTWSVLTTLEMNCPGDMRADKAKEFIGRDYVESHRIGNPGELLCCMALSLSLYGNGVSFWSSPRVILSVHNWSNCGSFWQHVISRPKWNLEWKISGGWQDIWSAGISSLLLAPLILPISSLLEPPVVNHSYKWLLLADNIVPGLAVSVSGALSCHSEHNIENTSPLLSLGRGASMGFSATN